MARIWNSFSDIDRAVATIKAFWKAAGGVPDELVRAYRESLGKGTRGLVQRFYEGLAEKCPEALPLFVEQPEADES